METPAGFAARRGCGLPFEPASVSAPAFPGRPGRLPGTDREPCAARMAGHSLLKFSSPANPPSGRLRFPDRSYNPKHPRPAGGADRPGGGMGADPMASRSIFGCLFFAAGPALAATDDLRSVSASAHGGGHRCSSQDLSAAWQGQASGGGLGRAHAVCALHRGVDARPNFPWTGRGWLRVRPQYFLTLSPMDCLAASPFSAVSYRTWLPPYGRKVYVQQMPEDKGGPAERTLLTPR